MVTSDFQCSIGTASRDSHRLFLSELPISTCYFFELILYPPLLYYLERKHGEDSFIADKIARINQRQAD